MRRSEFRVSSTISETLICRYFSAGLVGMKLLEFPDLHRERRFRLLEAIRDATAIRADRELELELELELQHMGLEARGQLAGRTVLHLLR